MEVVSLLDIQKDGCQVLIEPGDSFGASSESDPEDRSEDRFLHLEASGEGVSTCRLKGPSSIERRQVSRIF